MKMKKLFAICLVALSALISVHLQAQEVETLVLIDTDMGKIKVKLFNDTPQHRDNFIKNVKEHRYDGLLFHRVIKQFMVQAGDINSKDAPMEQHLGDGDLDYTIQASPSPPNNAKPICWKEARPTWTVNTRFSAKS